MRVRPYAHILPFILVTVTLSAEIIDRIAVSVGNQVITEEQIIEEIRVTAFLNREPLNINPEAKRKAAERLIEQTLMRRDMDVTHYPLPPRSDAEPLEKEVRTRYATEQDFLEDLQRDGLNQDELRQHLWWQAAMLRFIDFHFRPAIQVPEADIREYYEKKVAEWREQGVPKIPTFEESRADIEKILTAERVDQAVDRWLGDARTRLDILYHQEAFQ